MRLLRAAPGKIDRLELGPTVSPLSMRRQPEDAVVELLCLVTGRLVDGCAIVIHNEQGAVAP